MYKLFCFQAIHLLPANTQIREIRVFLESVLEERAQRKRFDQVLKSLLQAEFLRVSPGCSGRRGRGLGGHRVCLGQPLQGLHQGYTGDVVGRIQLIIG